ncbi:MAG TPA: hypothetical protein VMX13_07275 [Sedimentisphaerales bacterium]|nr:hypothetical protein [Sedimentisphaerales bacterium]
MLIRKALVLMIMSLILYLCRSAPGGQMAIWDFGPDGRYTETVTAEHVTGTPALTVSESGKDPDGGNGAAYTDSEGAYHSAGQAVNWDDTGTRSEWTMQINTTGWEDICIRWDYRSDNEGDAKGPTQFDFCYKVGEGGSIESIVEIPASLAGSAVQLILDDGRTNWYADAPAVDSKSLPPTFQKYRSDWVRIPREIGLDVSFSGNNAYGRKSSGLGASQSSPLEQEQNHIQKGIFF